MERPMEEWRPIKGYEGLYEASNYGRIKSIERDVDGHIFNGTKSIYHKKERIMCCNTSKPYKQINLYDRDGNITQTLFHIEIAKAFPEICGEWFDGCEVHHKDFNPSRNMATNLQVLTRDEHNKIHMEKRIQRTKESNSLPVLQYTLDGEFIAEYKSMADAARELFPNKNTRGVSGNISAVCKGKRHYAYGFVWKYKSVS